MSGRNKAAASRVRKGSKSKRSLAGTGRPGDSGKSATKHPVPWSSAFHLQPKPSRGVRLCGDFRDLNAKTVLDSFPLPNLRHFTHQLKSSNTFMHQAEVVVIQVGDTGSPTSTEIFSQQHRGQACHSLLGLQGTLPRLQELHQPRP